MRVYVSLLVLAAWVVRLLLIVEHEYKRLGRLSKQVRWIGYPIHRMLG
ncbi:hypothetical protein BH24ACT21_BH24ACT21_01280 [soil metagenome]